MLQSYSRKVSLQLTKTNHTTATTKISLGQPHAPAYHHGSGPPSRTRKTPCVDGKYVQSKPGSTPLHYCETPSTQELSHAYMQTPSNLLLLSLIKRQLNNDLASLLLRMLQAQLDRAGVRAASAEPVVQTLDVSP